MDVTFENFKALIAEKLDTDPAKITMEANFRTDLDADSLDTYELIYSIEENLGVSIPDDVANGFETVGDAFNFVVNAK